MFKHNDLQKLAFDNIRKQKSFYRFLFIALVLVFTLSTCIAILFSSYEAIGYKERYLQYGRWSAALITPQESTVETLKTEIKDLKVGYMGYVGNVSYQDYQAGHLYSLDQEAMELAPLTLIKGRFPVHQNEIILTENQCTILGISQNVNQRLELEIIDNDDVQIQEFKIVGIIDNQLHSGILEIGDYITTQCPSSQKDVLIYAENTKRLWNTIIEEKFDEETLFNEDTYNQYKNIGYYDNPYYTDNDITNVFQYLIAVLGFIGVFGTMASSLAKRTEHFVLMKALGATSKQLQKIIVYEGLMLSVIAGIVGFVIGNSLSFIVLYSYHLFMSSDFMFIYDGRLLSQIVISIISIVIGIYLPSFETYYVSLSQQVKQQVSISRNRKVHKLNVFSLALKEFSLHKWISISLIVVIVIGIVIGVMFFDSIRSYQKSIASMNKKDNYDYTLNDYGELTNSDILSLTAIENVTSQVIHIRNIDITWQGIDAIKEILPFREGNSHMKYAQDAIATYYEDEDMIKEILSQYHMEGRYPQNDHEVLIIKPWVSISENGMGFSQSYIDRKDIEYVEEVGLDIGDKISVGCKAQEDGEVNHMIDEPFEIVGTITFDHSLNKNSVLFRFYQLISTKSSYQKYFQTDNETTLLFDVNTQQADIQLKNTIQKAIYGKHHIKVQDYQQEKQNHKMLNLQFVFKVGPFCGTLLAGIIVLTYLYRKIKILGAKHEIGLYRAIGATKKQIYLIHFLYGLLIYLTAVLILVFFVVINLKDDMTSFFDSFIVKEMGYVCMLGILFMMAILVPVYSALKENIMQTITKQ